jgi:hypothetical protein
MGEQKDGITPNALTDGSGNGKLRTLDFGNLKTLCKGVAMFVKRSNHAIPAEYDAVGRSCSSA